MPVTRVRIGIQRLYVRSEQVWGEANWRFEASVGGTAVGDPTQQFVARSGDWIEFPDSWSRVVDVSALGETDTIRVVFSATEVGDPLDLIQGQVEAVYRHPFLREEPIPLRGTTPNSPAEGNYDVHVLLVVEEVVGSTGPDGPQRIAVSRQPDGSTAFSTAAGAALTPRIEICPVVPVPAAPSALPRRPTMPVGSARGVARAVARPPALRPAPALNCMVNPSFIPFLQSSDRHLNTKAARIAVTYVAPGNLDLSLLYWQVASGPAVIIGDPFGPEIKVRGTHNASGDRWVQIEARWARRTGPVMATFRAWTGKVKRAPYRINRLIGSNAAATPQLSAAELAELIQIVRRIYWGAGIDLVADRVTTCYDGAVVTGTAGVFDVTVADNQTVNVAFAGPVVASRVNFRPGVINLAIVRSSSAGRAWASYIQGVTGANETLDGTPSASWVRPTGVAPDAAAAAVTMQTFPVSTGPAPDNAAYITARAAVDAGFSAASMGRLYAAVIPSDWAVPPTTSAAVNIGHEIGHVLGLRHRGSGDSGNPPLSDDGVNSVDTSGTQRGHPWHENIMTYGYGGNASPPRALDLDLIQTKVIRRHPCLY